MDNAGGSEWNEGRMEEWNACGMAAGRRKKGGIDARKLKARRKLRKKEKYDINENKIEGR